MKLNFEKAQFQLFDYLVKSKKFDYGNIKLLLYSLKQLVFAFVVFHLLSQVIF